MLEDLGYVRQLNEGVSRIYESMEKSMLSLPEYKERNGNVFLTLKNRVSDHSKTIHTSLMKEIESKFPNYNETQRNILSYLFYNGSATLLELSEYSQINENTIRSYLNAFMNDNLIERQSNKKRDINAKYAFKKE